MFWSALIMPTTPASIKSAPTLALVQTVDFFTPIVDDPFTFGQIAATNALSDVYAMGGRPITALAHVCFPASGDLEVLEQILAGGLSKMVEANCTVVGGHSIRDEETKFGYSVTGLIHPGRVFTNGGARTGDRLLFTKSLGTGVISTAIKQGTAKQPGSTPPPVHDHPEQDSQRGHHRVLRHHDSCRDGSPTRPGRAKLGNVQANVLSTR